MKKIFYFGRIDFVLPLIAFLLSILSIATIYTITYSHDGISTARDQGIFIIVGFIVYFAVSSLDYKVWRNLSFPVYLILLFLLAAVMFIGKKEFGATRWLDFGFVRFQPSELMKIFLVLFISRFLESRVGRIKLKHLVVLGMIVVIPTFLVLKQPDLGTATVLLVLSFAIIVAAKLNWKYILGICSIVLASLPLIWMFGLKSFQRDRLLTFLNPTRDPYDTGYNVLQSIIAVGSGGIKGQGFGQGSQSQLNYLPVAHADFIFSGFAEATGFIGAVFLLLLFSILIGRILFIATKSKDAFGQLVAIGICTMFLWEIFINIGMNIGLAPVTGIPLPFMSYGGTAIVSNFFALGILQNIYLRSKEEMFNN